LKKIDTKEYQDLIGAFERYKEFYDRHGNVVTTDQEDEILRQNMMRLQSSYDYYCTLLSELKSCIQNYRRTKDALKTTIHNRARKMNNMSKNKK
jgi:uncharacterized protein YutE (UPF0331/DUF86 family)